MRRTNVRRSLLAAGVVLIMGLVTACGGSSSSTTATGQISAETAGTLRVLMEGVPDTDIVKGLLADFN
ncbi:MAG: sugar ABC transporter substrate-binding protein, partial [Candidatus Planktophila sp.]